ncbi:MAG: DUF2442 domain-containing protein [Spirochaetes bacterium]|nr:MAG: DUF2442 domain-containing protein [Spirochaetota bacterium]
MRKISDVAISGHNGLLVRFADGDEKICDIAPFLERGDFQELKDPSLFKTAKSITWGVEWDNGLDLSADTLDAIGKPAENAISGERQKP